MELKNFHQSS